MGTIYYVGCLDCGIYRDLYEGVSGCLLSVKERHDAMIYREIVYNNAFCYGLLVSFLLEHAEHRCKFFSEHDEEYEHETGRDHKGIYDEDDYIIINGKKLKEEKSNFWECILTVRPKKC